MVIFQRFKRAIICVVEGMKKAENQDPGVPPDTIQASAMAMKFLAGEIMNVKGLFDQLVDYKVKNFPSQPGSTDSSQGCS